MSELLKIFNKSLESNVIFQGGFFLGILTTIGYVLKPIPGKIFNWIKRKTLYTTTVLESDPLYASIELWLTHNYPKQYRNTETSLSNGSLIVKQFDDVFYIRFKRKYLRIYKGREKLENANHPSMAFYSSFQIIGIFAKNKIEALFKEIIDFEIAYNEKNTEKYFYTWDLYSSCWKMEGSLKKRKSLEHVFIDKKDFIIKDIEEFKKSKSWYENRFITFKRGYLLFGNPGNGKTSLSIALGKHFGLNVYSLNLNSLGDSELKRTFSNLPPNGILLIEDIDSAYSKRKSAKDKDEHIDPTAPSTENMKANFSFSTLLNCLDGLNAPEDTIIIFTTNHIENLDPALIRPGRIDFKVEVKNPSKNQIEAYLTYFYEKNICLPFETYELLTMADVENSLLKNKFDSDAAINDLKSKLKLLNA